MTQIALTNSILGIRFTNGYQIYKDSKSEPTKISQEDCSIDRVSSNIKDVSKNLQSITDGVDELVEGQKEISDNVYNLYTK